MSAHTSAPHPTPVQAEAGREAVIAPPGALAGAIQMADDFDAPLGDLFDRQLAPYGPTVRLV